MEYKFSPGGYRGKAILEDRLLDIHHVVYNMPNLYISIMVT